jgi:hypothetical protein
MDADSAGRPAEVPEGGAPRDDNCSRRVFVRRAAQVGVAATALVWTAPGLTSVALAGGKDDCKDGGTPTTEHGKGVSAQGGEGGGKHECKGSPPPTETTKKDHDGGPTTSHDTGNSGGGGGGGGNGNGGNGNGNGGNGNGGNGGVGDAGAGSGSGNNVASGDPSSTGSGGSLPFTGGDGRDLALLGVGAVVLGRIVYSLRRVVGGPDGSQDAGGSGGGPLPTG